MVKSLFGSLMYAQKKDVDFGFAGMYVDNMRQVVKKGGDGGCERVFEAMDKDIFFTQKYIYAVLHGCNCKATPLGDMWRMNYKWDYDCGSYKGHCAIYNGKEETVLATNAEQNKRAVPQADLVLMDHGHTTIMMEAPTIIQALVDGETAAGAY
jgi:hypothetical protein